MNTVEVFKTNVNTIVQARKLVTEIQRTFVHYRINFDLEDCDRILRIESASASIEIHYLVDMLSSYGVKAEVLEDVVPLMQ